MIIFQTFKECCNASSSASLISLHLWLSAHVATIFLKLYAVISIPRTPESFFKSKDWKLLHCELRKKCVLSSSSHDSSTSYLGFFSLKKLVLTNSTNHPIIYPTRYKTFHHIILKTPLDPTWPHLTPLGPIDISLLTFNLYCIIEKSVSTHRW